jgi:hypothetical protein
MGLNILKAMQSGRNCQTEPISSKVLFPLILAKPQDLNKKSFQGSQLAVIEISDPAVVRLLNPDPHTGQSVFSAKVTEIPGAG